jgi:hypothetical protein
MAVDGLLARTTAWSSRSSAGLVAPDRRSHMPIPVSAGHSL